MIPEWIQTWMALCPNAVRAWAVLVILDLVLFALVPFIPEDDEDEGFESASAVGVVDDLRAESIRGP